MAVNSLLTLYVTASAVRFLKSSEIKQEFTHVATPEENSYIEAFHSVLEHDVIERNEFASYYESAYRSRQRPVEALFFPLQPHRRPGITGCTVQLGL